MFQIIYKEAIQRYLNCLEEHSNRLVSMLAWWYKCRNGKKYFFRVTQSRTKCPGGNTVTSTYNSNKPTETWGCGIKNENTKYLEHECYKTIHSHTSVSKLSCKNMLRFQNNTNTPKKSSYISLAK